MKLAILFMVFFANLLSSQNVVNAEYSLVIIHVNDFHSKFDEMDEYANICKPGTKCIGGYARMVSVVKQIREKHKDVKDRSTLFLNLGDNFTGSLWYRFFKWEAITAMLNHFPPGCMTLGTHEFDNGIDGLTPFLENIKSPVVLTNMDSSGEPSMNKLYKNMQLLQQGRRVVGVLGAILPEVTSMADTGNLLFKDVLSSIKAQADWIKSIYISDIVVVLSQCGLEFDKYLAANVGESVDIIVGGHSHSFLYNGTNVPGPDEPVGEYPVVVTTAKGKKIPIITASAYGKYVGEFITYYDEDASMLRWEGNPVFVGPEVVPDAETVAAMKPWQEVVDRIGLRVVGESLIDMLTKNCGQQECLLANLITEAYRRIAVNRADDDEWTSAEISLINTDGIRTSLTKGYITYSDVASITPYGNSLYIFDIRGDKLLQALETSVSDGDVSLHQTGMKIRVNLKKQPGERVVEVKVVCRKCRVPIYEKIDLFKDYRVIAQDFLVFNRGNFSILNEFGRNKTLIVSDIDALASYIEATSPIALSYEGRWSILR